MACISGCNIGAWVKSEMKLTPVFVLALTAVLSSAPLASPQTPMVQLIAGVVRDPKQMPICGAIVKAQNSAGITLAQTSTEQDGTFSLRVSIAETLSLRVTKSGFHDSLLPLTNGSFMDLQVDLLPVQSASDPMQFDDKPTFSVSGITDWTAAGGHGSDANLRASESLARDARTLGVAPAVSANESENALKAALVRGPASFDANHALGSFYVHARRFSEAIAPLSKAFEVNPGNYENSYELAQAYEGAGEHDRARDLVRQLLSRNDRADLHRLLADIEESSNRPLAAEGEYERAVQQDPSEENYFAWAGDLLVHRAVEPAIEIFTKGARAYPRSERMLAGLGAALYANGHYGAAAQRVCDAAELNPSDSNPYLFLGEMQQFSSEPLPCAKEKLARFARDQPKNPWAIFYYAMALSKTTEPGRGEHAHEIELLLEQAIKADPKFAPAYLQLGILLYERGDSAKAVEQYQRSIAADPNLSEAHFRLGQAYRRAGENAKASQEFQTFDRLKRSEAASVEQHRRQVRQFVVVLKNSPSTAPK
jgi:tetratricopeptide (TPR) repeat protein